MPSNVARPATSLLLAIAVALSTSACPAPPVSEPAPPFVDVPVRCSTSVDLLFVVDDSGSMAEEQRILVDQVEVLLGELVAPEPRPDGSVPEAVELHVGVVSTDLGSGGFTIMTCRYPELGRDGVLQNEGCREGCLEEYEAAECEASGGCPWLLHSVEHPDDGSEAGNPPIWEDFACIATLGTQGCGLEQQLEASLRAVTDQVGPGGANEGFLRDDSVLAIVYVTDEDDCSASDVSMFDPSAHTLGPLGVRCLFNDDLLHPLERYVEGFAEARAGDARRVVVGAIVGIPPDGSWSWDFPPPEEQVNPADPCQRLMSCDSANGVAFPPYRIASLVRAFGDNGVLGSICREDWTDSFREIAETIRRRVGCGCAGEGTDRRALGGCRVVETLSNDRPCPHPASPPDGSEARGAGWQRDLGVDERGRRRCEILRADLDDDGCPDGACACEGCPLGAARCGVDVEGDCLQGWFAREGSECAGELQVLLTAEVAAALSGTVRLECPTEPCPRERQNVAAARSGASCDPLDPRSCESEGEHLRCVRHESEVCGDNVATCGRCSPTIESLCPRGVPGHEAWIDEPLLGPGGCCHEGFVVDRTSGECRPDGATGCLDESCRCLVDAECDDGLPCNGAERCEGCECLPGAPLDCDDGDSCTDDSCTDIDGIGCLHTARDLDGDGFGDEMCGGDDCDDDDAQRNPSMVEICNFIDDDCDGLVDEPEETPVTVDGDDHGMYPSLLRTASGLAVAWAHSRDGGQEVALFLSPDGGGPPSSLILSDRIVDGVLPAAVWTGDVLGVAWVESDDEAGRVVYAAATPSGESVAGPVTVADGAASLYVRPSVVWTGEEIALAWSEPTGMRSSAIFLARLTPEGERLGEDLTIGDLDSPWGVPTLVAMGDSLGLVFGGPGDPMPAVYYLHLSLAGEALGPVVRLDETEGGCGAPAAVWTGSELVVAWTEAYVTWTAVRLDPTGAPVGEPVHSPALPGRPFSMDLAWTGSELGVLWELIMVGERQLFFARFDATLAVIEPPLQITTEPVGASSPSLVWEDTVYTAAWNVWDGGPDRVALGRFCDL